MKQKYIKYFILSTILLTLNVHAVSTVDKLQVISEIMNKTNLTEKEIAFFENSARFSDDKNLIKPIRLKKQFFSNNLWKVKPVLHTLLLTYSDQTIITLNINKEHNKFKINEQEFSFDRNKSLSRQIESFFSSTKKTSLFHFLIEEAKAKETSNDDMKRFIVGTILADSASRIQDHFTSSFENSKFEVKIELDKDKDVKLPQSTCSPNKTIKGTALITLNNRDKIPIPFETSLDKDGLKMSFNIDKESQKYSVNLKPRLSTEFINAAQYGNFLTEVQDQSGGKDIVLLKNTCRYCDDEESTQKPDCTQCEQNGDAINYLYDVVSGAFEAENYLAGIQICFIDKNQDWRIKEKKMSLNEYKECLTKIHSGQLKPLILDQEALFDKIDFTKVTNANIKKHLPEDYSKLIDSYNALKNKLKNIKDRNNYECSDLYYECSLSPEFIDKNPQVKNEYENYFKYKVSTVETLRELKAAFEMVTTLANARVACCFDKVCEGKYAVDKNKPIEKKNVQ